jgi:hypothetical protein
MRALDLNDRVCNSRDRSDDEIDQANDQCGPDDGRRWNLGRATPGTEEPIAGPQEIAAKSQPSRENNRAQYQRLDGLLECRGRAIGDQRVLDTRSDEAGSDKNDENEGRLDCRRQRELLLLPLG